MNINIIEKHKKEYLNSNLWSKLVQQYLNEIDFSKVFTKKRLISETKIRIELITCLIKHNFSPKNIITLLITEYQYKRLTLISHFIKTYIFNHAYFINEINETKNILRKHKVNDSFQNIVQFYAGALHKCKMCDNLTFRVYCSQKCMGKDPKRKYTFIKNITSEIAVKHRKQTCLNNYGDENVFGKNSTVVKEIRRKTLKNMVVKMS